MGEHELWVNMNMGDTHRQTDMQTDRRINTMTRPGLRAGLSENRSPDQTIGVRNFVQKCAVYLFLFYNKLV